MKGMCVKNELPRRIFSFVLVIWDIVRRSNIAAPIFFDLDASFHVSKRISQVLPFLGFGHFLLEMEHYSLISSLSLYQSEKEYYSSSWKVLPCFDHFVYSSGQVLIHSLWEYTTVQNWVHILWTCIWKSLYLNNFVFVFEQFWVCSANPGGDTQLYKIAPHFKTDIFEWLAKEKAV